MYKPKVSLINPERYKYIIHELYSLWHQSRTDDPLLTTYEIGTLLGICDSGTNTYEELLVSLQISGIERAELVADVWKRFGSPRKVFKDIIRSNIPIGEAILFVFVLEDIPVVFREQLVRHKEKRVHQQASYWSQSSRCRPLEEFFDGGFYYIPDSIEANWRALSIYREHMQAVQTTYNRLLDAGIHQDDARAVMPMAMTHRISFHTNLRNLISLFQERSCWIAQANLWLPIVSQMVDLIAQVEPSIRNSVEPPCSSNGQFNSCPYKGDNDLRVKGLDPAPACPLYTLEQGINPHEGLPNSDQILPMSNLFAKVWPSGLVDLLRSANERR